MKTIKKLTEQEILSLTEEQLKNMVNLEKAKKGIKIMQKPQEPNYLKVPEKDCEIYYCSSLGDLAFKDITELQSTLKHLKSLNSIGQKNYSSEGYFFKNEIKPRYSSEDWDKITSEKVFDEKVLIEAKETIKLNSRAKKEYEEKLSEWKQNQSESKEIYDFIYNKYNDVCEKFRKLENYVSIMRRDYVPLAEGDLLVALKFFDKAYFLYEEEKDYVLDKLGYNKIANENE